MEDCLYMIFIKFCRGYKYFIIVCGKYKEYYILDENELFYVYFIEKWIILLVEELIG